MGKHVHRGISGVPQLGPSHPLNAPAGSLHVSPGSRKNISAVNASGDMASARSSEGLLDWSSWPQALSRVTDNTLSWSSVKPGGRTYRVTWERRLSADVTWHLLEDDAEIQARRPIRIKGGGVGDRIICTYKVLLRIIGVGDPRVR